MPVVSQCYFARLERTAADESRFCKKKMAEKIDCIEVSDSGSTSPNEDLQEIQEIAQGVDSIEISDDSEEFLNVKANPGLNPNSARKEIHIIEGPEETELERILKKNEYYKRPKKDCEFVEIEEAAETELERILKKNEYYKRLKKDREFVEILDKPDGSLLSKPSTSKQEDIQIISKKRGCSMISTKPLEPKSSQSMVQLTQTKRKINPGDIFRKTYFLGSDVQREKIGNVTKKLHYYKALTCLECNRTFHTRFGLEMHHGTIHPNGQPFNQMTQFEEIDCTDLSDD